MTTRSIFTALALGFFAFTLSVLPITPAQAACAWKKGCQPNETNHGGLPATPWVVCCTGGWSKEAGPCPPGWKLQPNGGCLERKVKDIGKAKTTDDTPGVLKAVRACRAKGPEYEYDVQAALCVQKAEKHDDKPKNNKKKKKHDDDEDDDD
jgi:hypothetical protein